jgi:hypothetical protein
VSREPKVFWARAICFATSGEVLCELKATSSRSRILSVRLEGTPHPKGLRSDNAL